MNSLFEHLQEQARWIIHEADTIWMHSVERERDQLPGHSHTCSRVTWCDVVPFAMPMIRPGASVCPWLTYQWGMSRGSYTVWPLRLGLPSHGSTSLLSDTPETCSELQAKWDTLIKMPLYMRRWAAWPLWWTQSRLSPIVWPHLEVDVGQQWGGG